RRVRRGSLGRGAGVGRGTGRTSAAGRARTGDGTAEVAAWVVAGGRLVRTSTAVSLGVALDGAELGAVVRGVGHWRGAAPTVGDGESAVSWANSSTTATTAATVEIAPEIAWATRPSRLVPFLGKPDGSSGPTRRATYRRYGTSSGSAKQLSTRTRSVSGNRTGGTRVKTFSGETCRIRWREQASHRARCLTSRARSCGVSPPRVSPRIPATASHSGDGLRARSSTVIRSRS